MNDISRDVLAVSAPIGATKKVALEESAHAVLLPVVGDLKVEPWLDEALARGTVAVLIAETRDEYVARRMSPARRRSETRADIQGFADSVRVAVGGPALVALDQEPWGIQRLHDLVKGFPIAAELTAMSDAEIASSARGVATGAREMGVNMFLSPVVDVLVGENPWLQGRTLDLDPREVGRIAAAFVRGVQEAGVVAVAKHFPGYPELAEDPALHDTFVATFQSRETDLDPFVQVVRAGVLGVLTGPAIVAAVDPDQPSSTSASTIDLLRGEIGFSGLVVSDDLEAPSTTRGRSLSETAVASLAAGTDLLLVGGGPEIGHITEALVDCASTDEAFSERLIQAADRVRGLAVRIDGPHGHA